MAKTRFFAHGAILIASIGGASASHAEWNGKGELGMVLARGNTNTETINAKADMITEHDPWKHLIGFSALRSTSEQEVTGDRYEIHGQSDYKLSVQSYAVGSLRYESDQFSPYSYQAVAALGYGYRFYDSDVTKLSTELGVGYRYAKDRIAQDRQGNAIIRGAMSYEHKLTSTSDIYDKFLVESGKDNTFVQNELGIKVAINSSLALSVAHVVRHNSDVIAPKKNTDQLLTVNLVFAF